MQPTTPAAIVSAIGRPTNTPPAPTAAASEDMASERWCLAAAKSTGWRVRCPTARVMRKSSSFVRMQNAATTSGGMPIALSGLGSCRRHIDRQLCQAMVAPALARSAAMESVAARSQAGGALTATIVTASTAKSEPL